MCARVCVCECVSASACVCAPLPRGDSGAKCGRQPPVAAPAAAPRRHELGGTQLLPPRAAAPRPPPCLPSSLPPSRPPGTCGAPAPRTAPRRPGPAYLRAPPANFARRPPGRPGRPRPRACFFFFDPPLGYLYRGGRWPRAGGRSPRRLSCCPAGGGAGRAPGRAARRQRCEECAE